MIKYIIRTFGLKGSWKWAKKQMRKGKIVRCRHWSGALAYKIQSIENPLLLSSFSTDRKSGRHINFDTANHHLSYEDFTDYYVSL